MVKKFKLALLAAFVVMPASQLVSALEEVKINTVPVTDNLFMLSGKGGNIGLFTGVDGTFVIDDQYAPLTDKILAAIKEAGGDTPRFLINTHFHGDHTGGNENIGDKGTLIIAHDNVRERLVSGAFIAAFGMKAAPAEKTALPVITFSEDMHFHINDETVRAIHAPNGHTDGDSIIHFAKANVVHAGDTFFNGFYPFIDAAHGGTLKGAIQAADTILSITNDESKIIPGHGPMANRSDLQAYRAMLKTAYDKLLPLKNSGKSAAEAVAEKPLAELEDKWGKGLFPGDKWIEIIYPGVN